MKPKIVVVLGPTASGKSDLAVQLAREFNGEVISADSRQVYKGLDIGTGKINKKEMRGVPHYLLDVANPKKKFTVAQYKKLADKAIEKILKAGKTPIICGGTGFYIQALVDGIVLPEVAPNPKLRKQLGGKPVEELWKILENLDPERASEIDKHNPVRLIRAIEIALVLGRVPKLEIQNPKFEILKIGIKIDEKTLQKRINGRLVSRMRQGMVAEAKKLHAGGLSFKRMRELGLEYGRLADFLEGKISEEGMIEKLKIGTRQYAKRQMTWFKRDADILWLKPDIKIIEREVKKFLYHK